MFVVFIGNEAEILQLSASDVTGSEKFDRYVLPEKDVYICKQASEITGLTIVNRDGKKVLLHCGKTVPTVSTKDAMSQFVDWLKKFNCHCVLVGHNAHKFDAKHLLNAIHRCGLYTKFTNVVNGFGDTLPLFRSAHPNLKSYSQPNLYHHFLQSEYSARRV